MLVCIWGVARGYWHVRSTQTPPITQVTTNEATTQTPPATTTMEVSTQTAKAPTRSYAEAATSTTPSSKPPGPPPTRKDKGKQPATGPNSIPYRQRGNPHPHHQLLHQLQRHQSPNRLSPRQGALSYTGSQPNMCQAKYANGLRRTTQATSRS